MDLRMYDKVSVVWQNGHPVLYIDALACAVDFRNFTVWGVLMLTVSCERGTGFPPMRE